MDSPQLVSINPASVLVFELKKDTQPRTVLKVTNVSKRKVAFKVKTTQPSWYYVRPNQNLLGVGQSEDVAIVLVDTACNNFIHQVADGQDIKLDKHRFLVLTKIIEDDEYARLMSLSSTERTEEYTKIWDGPKDDKVSTKLRVEFEFPGNSASRNASTENSSALRKKISRNDIPLTTRGNSDENANNPEALFNELQTLRKKYDAVVEYTVHLTAERDAIVSQLESSQRELTKEKSKKRSDGPGSNSKGDRADKKSSEKGFSLFVVLLAALLCFLLGRYLQV